MGGFLKSGLCCPSHAATWTLATLISGCLPGVIQMKTLSTEPAKILFASPYQSAQPYQPKIWVMNADGSAQTNITNFRYVNSSGVVDLDRSNDERPAWSPDGRFIAFVSSRGGVTFSSPLTMNVWVMNADGSLQFRLLAKNSAI